MSAHPCSIEATPDADGGDGAQLARFGDASFRFSPRSFAGTLDGDEKKRLFKAFVTRVLLEVSSYCNRQCSFCPNASGLRLSKEEKGNGIDPALLADILKALQSIDYDRDIVLHLYNEPMADPALADKVAVIAKALPKATIWFNTNGDYLTRERLAALAEAGLSHLNVSLYGPNHGDFDVDYLTSAFDRIFNAVGARAKIRRPNEYDIRTRVVFEHDGRTLPITIFASDFNEIGYDRGKSVETGERAARTSPCPAVFSEFNIAWDGTVVPCCNVHPHEPDHRSYVIGAVARGEDMFDLYHSATLRGWRRSLARFGSFQPPCDTCTRLNFPALADTPEAAAFNDAMSRALPAQAPFWRRVVDRVKDALAASA